MQENPGLESATQNGPNPGVFQAENVIHKSGKITAKNTHYHQVLRPKYGKFADRSKTASHYVKFKKKRILITWKRTISRPSQQTISTE